MFAKLLLLFILVPLAELYIFSTLGRHIGLSNTILVIIATAFLGAWLTKSQGRKAIEKFQKASSEGRLPATEALEGILILIAGAVLITPGFLTDTVGFLLLVPPVRTIMGKILAKRLKGKIQVVTPEFSTPEARPKSKLDDGNVIDV